jgi:hypothetical protein
MRILWCLPARATPAAGAHAELASELVLDLCAAGDEATVLCAALPGEDDLLARSLEQTDGLLLERCVRADPEPRHWQRSRSAAVAERFASRLRSSAAELVVVAGWLGLSCDLVELASRAGVPAIVLADEPSATCLLHTRRLPDTEEACDAVLAANPCLGCARRAGLGTPWVPIEAQHLSLAELRAAIRRELELAVFVVASADEERRLLLRLELDPSRVAMRALPAGPRAARAEAFRALCAQALVACDDRRAPARAADAGSRDDWFGERMRRFAEEQWDAHAVARSSGRSA